MFTVLTVFFSEPYHHSIKEIAQKSGHIKIYKADGLDDLRLFLDKQDIDCFLFYCDADFSLCRKPFLKSVY